MKLYNDPLRGIVFNPNWPVEPKDVKCNFGFLTSLVAACACAEVAFESGANHDVVDEYDDNCPHRYNSVLQTAIGEANGFENHNEMFFIIQDACMIKGAKQFKLEPATFYEVPDMKLELVDFGNGYFAKQLYRIVSEPKQEPKVETQEELWKYVITQSVSWNGHKNDLRLIIDQFQKEGYFITRKQS